MALVPEEAKRSRFEVLDVAAGTGRVGLPLTEAGFRCVDALGEHLSFQDFFVLYVTAVASTLRFFFSLFSYFFQSFYMGSHNLYNDIVQRSIYPTKFLTFISNVPCRAQPQDAVGVRVQGRLPPRLLLPVWPPALLPPAILILRRCHHRWSVC